MGKLIDKIKTWGSGIVIATALNAGCVMNEADMLGYSLKYGAVNPNVNYSAAQRRAFAFTGDVMGEVGRRQYEEGLVEELKEEQNIYGSAWNKKDYGCWRADGSDGVGNYNITKWENGRLVRYGGHGEVVWIKDEKGNLLWGEKNWKEPVPQVRAIE